MLGLGFRSMDSVRVVWVGDILREGLGLELWSVLGLGLWLG